MKWLFKIKYKIIYLTQRISKFKLLCPIKLIDKGFIVKIKKIKFKIWNIKKINIILYLLFLFLINKNINIIIIIIRIPIIALRITIIIFFVLFDSGSGGVGSIFSSGSIISSEQISILHLLLL